MAQSKKQKPQNVQKEEEVKDLPEKQDKTEEELEREAALDDLLEDIDDVLEENAESFVKEYVQKGGE